MRDPMLRAWVQESVPPAAHYDFRPGYWLGEASWPGPNVQEHSCSLGRNTLSAPAAGGGIADGDSPVLAICLAAERRPHGGNWCPHGKNRLSPEMPLDQREDDGGSLIFDSEPLVRGKSAQLQT